MLGDISSKYESGNKGFEAISNIPNDPGGASYGKYQLSSKTGTLTAFLREFDYEKDFEGAKPGTPEFNQKWVSKVKADKDFCIAQWQYIRNTKFQPISNHAYKELHFPKCAAVDELLWSLSVQHGRWAVILQRVAKKSDPRAMTQEEAIKRIMDERVLYVNNLKSLDQPIKNALNKRYRLELTDLLLLEAQHDHG